LHLEEQHDAELIGGGTRPPPQISSP